MRRVLRVTTAATLSSLMRNVSTWADASAVPCKASARKRSMSTYRVFDSLDALEDHLEIALRDFELDPQSIRFIVAWPWTIDALQALHRLRPSAGAVDAVHRCS